MKYRKEIDGLRAVAVLPVILFHAGFDLFSGGFVGVDVFFVISGYLITTIILTEREAGTFTILNFYERRARRILPALFFVMIVSAPFAWEWMLPIQLKDFSQSFVAVSLFSSNILFWLESGYFEAAAELKPFLHTWSLAVEEQFYLLFPLFILFTWKFGKRKMFAALLLIGFFSVSLSQWMAGHHPSANFYLLPTRLWELLIGSLTAFYLLNHDADGVPIYDTQVELLSAVGLLLVLYSIFVFDNQTPFPSFYALVPTVGTALIIIYGTDKTLTGQFLSNRLFVGVGLISYSGYLWHQPLFAFARLRSLTEPGQQLMLSLGVLSLLLAFLTWKYVEKPFRNKTRFNRKAIFQVAVGFSVFTISIGVAGHLNNGFDSRIAADGVPFELSDLSERIRVNHGLSGTCEGSFTLSDECRTNDNPEILVWGDSFAMHLMQGILSSNPNAKIIQMTKSVCGPLIDLAPTNSKYPASWADKCIRFNNQVVDWIESNNSVRYGVLGSPFIQYLTDEYRIKTLRGVISPDKDIVYEHLTATLDFLLENGIQPVVFAPPPSNGIDIGQCLVKASIFGSSVEKCNFSRSEYKNHRWEVLQLLERLEPKYRVIWTEDAICNGSTCNAAIEGTFIYRDERHFSHEGSSFVGKKMDFYHLIASPDSIPPARSGSK